MVMAFYSPSLLGREKVEQVPKRRAFPLDWTRGTTNTEKLQERRDCILEGGGKLNPNREEGIPKQTLLPQGAKTKKIRVTGQITHLSITLQAYSSRVFGTLRWKLTVRGTKDFRQRYPICMTDKDFEKRSL